MTLSIWRYSHLVLALIAATFLIIASITGIILAFEPINDAYRPFDKVSLKGHNLAETVEVLRNRYDEVLDIEIDANDFVLASVVTEEGTLERIYIHPATGEKLGSYQERHSFFQWTTNLHRSLFLKGVGRFFIGLASFLLCLIAVTGVLLLMRRQGGLRKVFSKVRTATVAQRSHIWLGKWFFVPILLIAATGVYLSAEKFSLLPEGPMEHRPMPVSRKRAFEAYDTVPSLFRTIALTRVRSVVFPFSEAPEDYYELALRDREWYVHQYSGEIISEARYPFVALASRFSLDVHTGRGSVLWSLVLLLSSFSLLYFMFSGFAIALNRKNRVQVAAPQPGKDGCEYILLVGSETGTTLEFATLFQNALIGAGKTVFKAVLNTYTTYENARHVVVFTATYGEGDPPANARRFKKLLASVLPKNPLRYSILGFGSVSYPDYCKFAIEVEEQLAQQEGFEPFLPLYKINNRSFEAFRNWVRAWSKASGVALQLDSFKMPGESLSEIDFKVVGKTNAQVDDTYLLRLRPTVKTVFASGDLWSFLPPGQQVPRLYSVARIEEDVLLSIKKHPNGLASNFLDTLSEDAVIRAAIRTNTAFHFPGNAKEVVCIANGTGIAPFLGMVHGNTAQLPLHLFWGGRTKKSFELYRPFVQQGQESGRLSSATFAYSKEKTPKTYAQDVLLKRQDFIAQKLETGAVFMLCGTIAMQHGTLEVLEAIASHTLGKPLSFFENRGQLRMDCY